MVESNYAPAEVARCSQIAEAMFAPVKCPKCKGLGYTGTPESEFPANYLGNGVACSCPAGIAFADFQMKWFSLAENKEPGYGTNVPYKNRRVNPETVIKDIMELSKAKASGSTRGRVLQAPDALAGDYGTRRPSGLGIAEWSPGHETRSSGRKGQRRGENIFGASPGSLEFQE